MEAVKGLRNATERLACVAIALGSVLAGGCSQSRSLTLQGEVTATGSTGTIWCSLDLGAAGGPWRSVRSVAVRVGEGFSLAFRDGKHRVIGDPSLPLDVVVSCPGYVPVKRTVSRQYSHYGTYDLGLIAITERLPAGAQPTAAR